MQLSIKKSLQVIVINLKENRVIYERIIFYYNHYGDVLKK